MIDHCIINPSRLQPKVDLKEEDAIRALFEQDFPSVVTGGNVQRPNRYCLALGYGQKKNYPIRIHFIDGDGRQLPDRIEVNFTVLMYGSNGRVLSEDEFHQACAVYLAICRLLFTLETYLRSLPGIVRNCTSYWGSIEWFVQGADPGRRMIESFKYAKHPRARKALNAGCPTKDNRSFTESRKLKGANLTIKLYSKSRQSWGYTTDGIEAFRFEVSVRFKELKHHLDYDTSEEEEPRLRTFTFEGAFEVLMGIATDMEQPRKTKRIEVGKSGHVEGLAQVALDLEVTAKQVGESYYSACKGSHRTKTNNINTAERLVSLAKVYPWREKMREFHESPLHVRHEEAEQKAMSAMSAYLCDQQDLPAVKSAYSETRFCSDDDCYQELAPWRKEHSPRPPQFPV